MLPSSTRAMISALRRTSRFSSFIQSIVSTSYICLKKSLFHRYHHTTGCVHCHAFSQKIQQKRHPAPAAAGNGMPPSRFWEFILRLIYWKVWSFVAVSCHTAEPLLQVFIFHTQSPGIDQIIEIISAFHCCSLLSDVYSPLAPQTFHGQIVG